MTNVTVYAPGNLDPYDSYGLMACELLRGLHSQGVAVNALSLGENQHANQPEDIAALTSRPITASFGGILLGYPTVYAKYPPLAHYGRRVALTMFESTKLPEQWADILNTMDAVITPSRFCRDVFANCGVTVPIHVIPLGIDPIYQPVKRQGQRPFTFLAIGDRGKRKGMLEAIQAFAHAFGGSPDHRLIIKTRDAGLYIKVLNENIDIIREDYTKEQMRDLYGRCDCLVFPTRGEGFGLPPREFAATGAPVIATEWGGTAEDIDLWGTALGYKLAQSDWSGVKRFNGMDLGQWAEPDIGHLSSLMCLVATYRKVYTDIAQNRAAQLHDLYNWQDFSQRVKEVYFGN